MIIGIDIDNTLNQLSEAVLSVYNEDAEDSLKIEDIKEYYIENFVRPQYKENFKNYFIRRDVWKRTKIMNGCQKYVAKLFNDGHTIYFITNTEAANIKKKADWLQRNFPYLNVRKCLFLAPKKQLIGGIDLLIDDCVDNIINAPYKSILLSYPWNRNYCTDGINTFRANNWEEIYNIINRLKD